MTNTQFIGIVAILFAILLLFGITVETVKWAVDKLQHRNNVP